jgi:hypothetical protein
MSKDTVEQWDISPAGNTDVGGVNIAELCSPSGINNAIRNVMAQVAVNVAAVRPISSGGTGGNTAGTALTSLGGGVAGIAVFQSATKTNARTALNIKLYTPQDVDPTCGTGGDDAVALQTFFDNISATEYQNVSWEGNYRTSVALTLGPATGTIATTNINGRFKLTGTSPMTTLLTFRNVLRLRAEDPIVLFGTGGTSNASRTITYGLQITGNSSRIVLGSIYGQYFGSYAVSQIWSTGVNMNINKYGQIYAYDCGSGYSSAGYTGNKTATFSARTDTGTSNSFGQRTTLTVSANIQSDIYGLIAAGKQHIYILYNGDQYYVMAQGAGTIDVFPWISGAATTGSIDYIYGGAFMAFGSDANNAYIDGIDAARCGIALMDASTYGASVERLQVGTCGIGHSFGCADTAGTALSGTSSGGVIQFYYAESDVFAWSNQTTNSANCGRIWECLSGALAGNFDETKMLKVAAPRTTNSSGTIWTTYSMQDGVTFPKKGVARAYEPVWETISNIPFNSATSVSIPDLGNYNEIEVRYEDCTFAAACSLLVRVSTDNGATYSAAGYQSTAANNDIGTTSTTSFALTDGTVTAMPYGIFRLSGFKDGSRRVQIDGILGGVHKVGGIWATAIKNNAIQLISNAQNWTGGNIVIRGLR